MKYGFHYDEEGNHILTVTTANDTRIELATDTVRSVLRAAVQSEAVPTAPIEDVAEEYDVDIEAAIEEMTEDELKAVLEELPDEELRALFTSVDSVWETLVAAVRRRLG